MCIYIYIYVYQCIDISIDQYQYPLKGAVHAAPPNLFLVQSQELVARKDPGQPAAKLPGQATVAVNGLLAIKAWQGSVKCRNLGTTTANLDFVPETSESLLFENPYHKPAYLKQTFPLRPIRRPTLRNICMRRCLFSRAYSRFCGRKQRIRATTA